MFVLVFFLSRLEKYKVLRESVKLLTHMLPLLLLSLLSVKADHCLIIERGMFKAS